MAWTAIKRRKRWRLDRRELYFIEFFMVSEWNKAAVVKEEGNCQVYCHINA